MPLFPLAREAGSLPPHISDVRTTADEQGLNNAESQLQNVAVAFGAVSAGNVSSGRRQAGNQRFSIELAEHLQILSEQVAKLCDDAFRLSWP